jgi:hypothetical protein
MMASPCATVVVSLAMYRPVATSRPRRSAASGHLPASRSSKPCSAAGRGPRLTWRRFCRRSPPNSRAGAPASLSVDELDASPKYDVEHIYFIDRSHKVFQTNLPGDMNLVFPESPFTKFLDTVYENGKVMSDGIDMSSLTGTLRTYSYYGPKDKNFIVETSTEILSSLSDGDFGWMGKYFFQDIFTDAIRSNEYVKDVDIYLVTPSGAWSLLHVGRKLAPDLVERTDRIGRDEVMGADGRHVTIYSRYAPAGGSGKDDPISHKLVIWQITYDTGRRARRSTRSSSAR